MNLTQTVDMLLGRLDPSMVASQGRETLLSLSRSLPAIERGGFEVRLHPAEPVVDLQQCVYANELPAVRTALTRLATHEYDAEAWSKVDRLLDWAEGNPAVSEVWLEFDSGSVESAEVTPVPSVFVGLEQAPSDQAAQIDDLSRHIAPDARQPELQRCFDACEGPAFISHAGFMLSRNDGALRLNIKRLTSATLPVYLERLGMSPDLPAPLLTALDLCDRFAVGVDLAQGIAPRIGLECASDDHNTWPVFLDALVQQGWMDAGQSSFLQTWPGASTPANEAAYPDHHLVAGVWRPEEFSRFVRRISHIKLVHSPGVPISCKGYLWFHHEWQRLDA